MTKPGKSDYVVYDVTTGIIKRWGTCSFAAWALQASDADEGVALCSQDVHAALMHAGREGEPAPYRVDPETKTIITVN